MSYLLPAIVHAEKQKTIPEYGPLALILSATDLRVDQTHAVLNSVLKHSNLKSMRFSKPEHRQKQMDTIIKEKPEVSTNCK